MNLGCVEAWPLIQNKYYLSKLHINMKHTSIKIDLREKQQI